MHDHELHNLGHFDVSDHYFEPIFCEEAVAVFDLDPLVKIVTRHAPIHYLNKKKESFSANLKLTIDYLKTINEALVSYTKQMFQVVSDSKFLQSIVS